MRILVTRPSRDGEAIARRLAALGHRALLAPLLTVAFLEGPPVETLGVQAVLITSANGVRALARRLGRRDIAIFAVGPQTAAAAHDEGFIHVKNAAGDAALLAEAVCGWARADAGILLHAAGEDAGNALCEMLGARGFQTRREVLYRIKKAAGLPREAADAIRQGEIEAVLFFSPQSALLFADCVTREGLSTARLTAICISAHTAEVLEGVPFAEIRIAPTPNQDALLACL